MLEVEEPCLPRDIWSLYLDFENFYFRETSSFPDFLCSWDDKLKRLTTCGFGLTYSDTLLGFKLLERCTLEPAESINLIISPEAAKAIKSESFLRYLKNELLKKYLSVDYRGKSAVDQDFMKQIIKVENGDLLSGENTTFDVDVSAPNAGPSNRGDDGERSGKGLSSEEKGSTDSALKNDGQNQYSCALCPKTFVRKTQLTEHLLTHDAVNPDNLDLQGEVHTCQVCNKKFGSLARLKKHCTVHSGFDSANIGLNKRKRHDEEDETTEHAFVDNLVKPRQRRHPCELCDYVARRIPDIIEHRAKIHGAHYPCDQCDYVSYHPDVLKRHKDRKHDDADYLCDHCDYVGSNRDGLRRHISSYHEGRGYSCDQCDYFVTDPRYVYNHKVKKHQGKCHLCDYKASSVELLKSHAESEHKDRESEGRMFAVSKPVEPFQRDSEYVDDSPSGLEDSKHSEFESINIGVNEPNLCNVGTDDTIGFVSTDNKITLQGKRRHYCELCDFVAKRLEDMIEHRDKMHGARYPCDHCDYIGSHPSLLKRHKNNMHEGKGYSCDQCDYFATERRYVYNHKVKEHEGKCKLCDYKASTVELFKSHIKSEHSKVEGSMFEASESDERFQLDNEYVDDTPTGLDERRYSEFESSTIEVKEPIFFIVDTDDKSGIVSTGNKNILKRKGRHPCELCDFVARRLEDIIEHRDRMHGLHYPCDQCDYIGGHPSWLKRHKSNKHEGRGFSCDQCDYFASERRYVYNHKVKKHEGKCHLCDYKASSVELLKSHIETQHEESEVEGPMLEDSKSGQTSHFATEPRQVSKAKKRKAHFTCHHCDYKAPTKALMKSHMLDLHKSQNDEARNTSSRKLTHQCDQCEYVSYKVERLNNHKVLKHEAVPFLCDMCAYSAVKLEYLKRHKAVHHDGFRLLCDQCDYSATTPVGLRYHKESKHEGVRYSCDQCVYVGKSALGLKFHQESKHEGKQYPCNQCDYVATIPASLKQHLTNKHGGQVFRCDECDYTATHIRYMKRHKEKKHEESQYRCDQCDYTAACTEVLRNHKESRHDDTQHKCDQCDYVGTTAYYLQRHKRKRHEVATYICDQCDYIGTSEKGVNNHKTQKHQILT